MLKRKLLLPLLLIVMSGCYTTSILPKGAALTRTPRKPFTTWSFFWGAIEDKHLKASDKVDCNGNGLASVTVKNNFGFILLSVITLGIVVPLQVQWDCGKDPQAAPPPPPPPGK